MKFSIKCFEFLTNKGNGKKCTLGPRIDKKLPDCPFILNGVQESFTEEQKIKYIYTLAKKCKEWHDRNNNPDHYFSKIEPQIDSICANINCKQNKILKTK